MRAPVRFLFHRAPGTSRPSFVAPLRESGLKPADEIARGTFLVASPMLRDPNFVRSVVLLCEHTEEGSWGLVVNRRTELTLGDVLQILRVGGEGVAQQAGLAHEADAGLVGLEEPFMRVKGERIDPF